MNEWLTVPQVCEVLHSNPETVRRLIRRGELPATKCIGKYLVAREWLDEYLDAGRVA